MPREPLEHQKLSLLAFLDFRLTEIMCFNSRPVDLVQSIERGIKV